MESQGGWSVARLGYRPALDGIRALAVFAVMLDHGGTRLVGGSIGVDVFFVLSGFLITSLLLEEWSLTTRIKLFEFYRRRGTAALSRAGGNGCAGRRPLRRDPRTG